MPCCPICENDTTKCQCAEDTELIPAAEIGQRIKERIHKALMDVLPGLRPNQVRPIAKRAVMTVLYKAVEEGLLEPVTPEEQSKFVDEYLTMLMSNLKAGRPPVLEG